MHTRGQNMSSHETLVFYGICNNLWILFLVEEKYPIYFHETLMN